jgi:hypothetical protein
VRAGVWLVEREIGGGMLGGVLLGAQEDREQRPAETDRGGADRQRVETERLGLGGLVRLGLGHGFRPVLLVREVQRVGPLACSDDGMRSISIKSALLRDPSHRIVRLTLRFS